MANSVNIQTILDGPRNCVVKVEGILDTSDLSPQTLVDPALLTGMDNTGTVKALDLQVGRVQYNVEDLLEVRLSWDATTATRLAEFTGRGTEKYERFGRLTNNSGAGRTGKILIATEGWSAGKVLSFTLIIELVKQGTL